MPRGPLRVAHDVVAEDLDAAGVGPHQPGQLPDERGLAGAVRPEQPEDLTAPDVEPDLVGGPHLGVPGAPAPAAHRGIGLGQPAHRAHDIPPCRMPVPCAYSRGTSLRGPGRLRAPGAPEARRRGRRAGLGRSRPRGRVLAAVRTSISRQNPARIAYRSCSSIWSSLCASSPNRAAYRSSSPSTRCGIRGYIAGQLLQMAWSVSRSIQRRANTCPTSKGSPPTVVMSSSRSAHRCSAVVSCASVGMDATSGGSAAAAAGRSTQPLSEDQRRVAVARMLARPGPGRPQRRQVLGRRHALGRGGTRSSAPSSRGGGAEVRSGSRRRPLGGGREGRLGQRRRQDRGDLGPRHGLRRADPAEVLGPYGLGDPGTVEHAPLVGLGDQVLGLVVVAVGGLHGPQVYGDAVLLGGHHARQQIAVAGDEDDVGAGAVAGQFGQLGVHGGVHALLRPPPVAAGQRAEPDGDPGHHAQPAVLGLRDAVGGAVEPVDAQQRPFGVGLGTLAQPLDQGGVIDGDPGAGGFPGEEAGGRAEQIPGVHQDDAAVHAIHPLSGRFASGFLRVCPTARRLTAGTRSSAWRIAAGPRSTSDNSRHGRYFSEMRPCRAM